MKKILVFFLVVSFFIPQTILADGMIIPPPDQNITQAQQRALIVHQNGIEDLIISLEFQGNAREFAWFLPVPDIPKIKKSDDSIFTKLGQITRPKKNLLEKLKGEDRYWPMPFFGGRPRAIPAEEKLKIIETKKVGILDVTVLTASSAVDLEEWLKDNGYQIPGKRAVAEVEAGELQPQINKARQIFQEYLDKGWYFVAAKIGTEFLKNVPEATPSPVPLVSPAPSKYFGQAHITPLQLTFKTEKIVYPMKISSLNDDSSPSVLLYLLADYKKRVPNYQYQYIAGQEEENFIFKTQYANKIQGSELKDWLPSVKDGYLTKLYASHVSPDQMREDLQFENAEDDRTVNTGQMTKKDWLILPLYLIVYGPIRILGLFTEGPVVYGDFFYQLGPIFPLILISFLGGAGVLWTLLFYFLLSRTRGRTKRAILYLLQFPGVWVLVNLLSLVFVIPCLIILVLLKVESQLILIHLLLKNNLGAVFFTAVFYLLQGRVHLIFKKRKNL